MHILCKQSKYFNSTLFIRNKVFPFSSPSFRTFSNAIELKVRLTSSIDSFIMREKLAQKPLRIEFRSKFHTTQCSESFQPTFAASSYGLRTNANSLFEEGKNSSKASLYGRLAFVADRESSFEWFTGRQGELLKEETPIEDTDVFPCHL